MNPRPDDSLNWIQEADGLGMIAKNWQAEVEQENEYIMAMPRMQSDKGGGVGHH